MQKDVVLYLVKFFTEGVMRLCTRKKSQAFKFLSEICLNSRTYDLI